MADALEAENRRLAEENQQLRQRNSMLTSLHVAAVGLLAAADRHEALATLQEIIVNLVGCEQFAIFDVEDGRLTLACHAGIEPARFANLPSDVGIIGRCATDGITRLAPFADERGPEEAELSACVPLLLDGGTRAVVALFRLLAHKARFELVDRELFELLTLYAALALYREGR